MNNYTETIAYLYSRLPMFTRIGPAAYKSGLGNITALCEHLHHPQKQYRTIHIAGTNGKGSTSHMLAAILQEAGYKTGLYTSPHLKDFSERIRINGIPVSQQAIIDFVQDHRLFFESLSASFFEVTTAMAFKLFADHQIDVAVIETGLGGRLDSTNIIAPDLSIITNISLDHTDLLGDSLPKIAFEKAGIIKANTPVVLSERQTETEAVFYLKAKSEDAPVYFASDFYQVAGYERFNHFAKYHFHHQPEPVSVACDLTGLYQMKNIAGVLTACDVLNEYGYMIHEDMIHRALSTVKIKTGLRGRWDLLQEKPTILADVGHNEGGLIETIQQLKSTGKKLHFVIGFVKDKDINKIITLFPKDATYYFCKPDLPRGLDVNELLQIASAHHLNGIACNRVSEALQKAKTQANADDIIYIGGSTFVVAEVL